MSFSLACFEFLGEQFHWEALRASVRKEEPTVLPPYPLQAAHIFADYLTSPQLSFWVLPPHSKLCLLGAEYAEPFSPGHLV